MFDPAEYASTKPEIRTDNESHKMHHNCRTSATITMPAPLCSIQNAGDRHGIEQSRWSGLSGRIS